MILVRAPLRISFVGGGTDLPDFYTKYTGRIVSTTIDKYIFIALHHTPMVDLVSARYKKSETVHAPNELEHTRIRAALVDAGITSNIEIGSFGSLPGKTGLGSSSSFSVALIKGLAAYQGRAMGAKEVAEQACRLEMDLLGEPVGRQDQYASAYGGFNVMEFHSNHSVDVSPLLVDYKKRHGLEKHVLLFYTGITRSASQVLAEQKEGMDKKFEVMKNMADSVPVFVDKFHNGDYEGMAHMLHEGWLRKRSLAAGISNPAIDALYDAGRKAGAWGGKVLGAGGGGCVMFMAPAEKHEEITAALFSVAKDYELSDARIIPVHFTQAGAEILYNTHIHQV